MHVCVCAPAVGMEKPSVVEQVDLPSSLALGLGLAVPQNSVGHLLLPLLEELPLRQQLRYLQLNTHQLSTLLRDSTTDYQRGTHTPTL